MSRLGIVADTHDNLTMVRKAVEQLNQLGVERVVHCGDVVAQFVLTEFGRLRMPLLGVFGNCDGDRGALLSRAQQLGFQWCDGPHVFTVGHRRLAVTHQPLDRPPDCDFYLHGHTHQKLYRPGRPTVVNPGEASGWLTGCATIAILDTDTGSAEFLDL